MILGVGSVLDPATAGLYINLGANFIVGSVTNPEVAKLCNRRKIAYFPGCATPPRSRRPKSWACEIVKVFPGSELGGPNFVKAIKGPTPWTKIMPTGGVEAKYENLKGWFDAGVTCVGMGSDLVRKDLIDAKDWAGMTRAHGAVPGLGAQGARASRSTPASSTWASIPRDQASAADIAAWYAKTFGFKAKEGNSSFFVNSTAPGRIEIMKSEPNRPCHIAILVSDFRGGRGGPQGQGRSRLWSRTSSPRSRPST